MMVNMNSLKLKLVGWFILILLVVLVIFSFLLYYNRKHNLQSNLENELQAQAYQMATCLELDEGRIYLKSSGPSGWKLPEKWYYVIYGSGDSQPLFSNIQDGKDSFQPGYPLKTLTYNIFPGPDKENYLWITYRVSLREDNDLNRKEIIRKTENSGCLLFIRIGRPMDAFQHELEEQKRILFILSFLIILMSGAGGFFLAHKALQPINKITAVLEEITDKNLGIRVDESNYDQEIHPLVQQLNMTLNRLENAFTRERQFISNVSHELRTPLTVLINNTEVVLCRTRMEEEYIASHRSNLEIARQMEDIIESLLSLSRIDLGRLSLTLENINLGKIVREVIEELNPAAETFQVYLHNMVDQSFYLIADPLRFKQVMRNLVENGIVYNKRGGEVIITAQKTTEGRSIIQVADNGPGISPQHLPYIFDRFYRVDDSRSRDTGGAGLGLAIAKAIIELHEGTLTVTSQMGNTIFIINLPES